MADLGVLRRVRRLVEAIVPWFDRAQADREHAELHRELEVSRAVRQAAVAAINRQELLRDSFTRAGERLRR